MKVKKVIAAANGQVSGGSEYGWLCYGPNARWIDFSNVDGSEVGSGVYDAVTKEVFEVEAYNDAVGYHCTWRAKAYVKAYEDEAARRGVRPYIAYDDVETAVVNKAAALARLQAYTAMSDNAPKGKQAERPAAAWPFPSENAEEESREDQVDDVVLDVTEEEPKAAFPDSFKTNEYEVVLNVKYRFTAKAKTMEDAAEQAADWVVRNRSSVALPEGFVWEDRWVSKRTVSEK